MRKSLSSISKKIFPKQVLVLGIPFILYIIFHSLFEIYLSPVIVKPILSFVSSIWYNDLIFVFIIAATIIFYNSKPKNYHVSKNITYLLSLFTLIYLYYRCVSQAWLFTGLYFLPSLKYGDFIVFITVCNVAFYITSKRKFKLRKNDINSFFDDESLGRNRTDELGYTKYAKLLATKIEASHFNHAFAIGVNGQWGLGKTSFVDLMKRNLGKEDNILVNFNSWNSNTPKAIIQDFFETLQEAIRPYHSSLARQLISYSSKIVELNENNMSRTFQALVSAYTGFSSLKSEFDQINSSLEEIGKKIIIFIDDLDRLDKEEIIEVIRLIRNTANFRNSFFIVAYDRSYILKALKEHNPYNHEHFLEKIFQIEITLPYFNKKIFRDKLFEKMKKCFPEKYHKEFEEEIIGTSITKPIYFNGWLENMRDVSRLANIISLNLSDLLGEVDLGDYIKVTLLHLKYPVVYSLIFQNPLKFLEIPNNRVNGNNKYQLRRIKNVEEFSGKEINGETYYIEYYLSKNRNEISIPELEINKIVEYLKILFDSDPGMFSKVSQLSIVHPTKFERYSAYRLLEGSLSEVEFNEALGLTQTELNNKILEWIKKGLESETLRRFEEIRKFKNKQEFEKIIRAIFFLAIQKPSRKDSFFRIAIGYDGQDLFSKICTDEVDKEEVKLFVKGLFEIAETPYLFESDFICYLNDRLILNELTDIFPIPKGELKSFVLNYFKKYCDEVIKLDNNVWTLFHNCKQGNWVPHGSGYQKQGDIPSKEANEIITDFITKKDLDGFLLSLIQMNNYSRKGRYFHIYLQQDLFKDWEDFNQFLSKQDESKWKYLIEFKQFFSAFKEKNFQGIEFYFNAMPISSNK